MKKMNLIKGILLSLMMAVFITTPFYSNLFDPEIGRKMYSVQTEHFDIIYTEESRNTAYFLASIADDRFETVADLLQFKPYLDYNKNKKIPVVISPDMETVNGFCSTYPYTHIALYQVPVNADSTIGNFSNHIESLFFHEMVHAISLNIRSPFWEFVSMGILGMGLQIYPNMYWMMPMQMIEGVTVSYESMYGHGRVNDPYITGVIKQDIVDDRFKKHYQVTGAYDRYPWGNLFYWYGGVFSGYVQNVKYTNGMELYGRLWNNTGKGNIFMGMNGNYKKTFKSKIVDDWKDFEEFMRIKEPVATNQNELLALDTKVNMAVSGLKSGSVYFLQSSDQALWRFDVKSGKKQMMMNAGGAFHYIDLSPEEDRLLISRSKMIGEMNKVFVQEYDLKRNRLTDLYLKHYTEAAYFKDGIAAVKINGAFSDLVFYRNGKEQLLLKGGLTRSFSSPRALDEETLVFIMMDEGKKKIGRYHFPTGKLTAAASPRIDYVRNLSTADGRIYFSYNTDYTLYKVAVIEDGNLYTQDEIYSGGVFHPVGVGDEIYYFAEYSDSFAMMKHPHRYQELNQSETLWDGLDSEPSDRISKLPEGLEEKSYDPLPYLMKPVWFTEPLIYMSYPFFGMNLPALAGYSVTWMMMDPIHANDITLTLGANWLDRMLIYNLNWNTTMFPLPFNLTLADRIQKTSYGRVRVWQGGLQTGYDWYYGLNNGKIGFDIGVRGGVVFLDPGDAFTAYQWPVESTNLVVGASFDWSELKSNPYLFKDRRGFKHTIYFDYNVIQNRLKLETSSMTALKRFPADFIFNTAVANDQILNLQSYDNLFIFHHYQSMTAFNSVSNRVTNQSSYLLQGNIHITGPKLEIQERFFCFPLYFQRLYLSGGYRGTLIESGYYHAVYGRLNNTTSILIGAFGQMPATAGMEFSIGIKDFDTSPDNIYFGIGTVTEF